MARPLREGVEALELTAKITLAVLALASGVYTYHRRARPARRLGRRRLPRRLHLFGRRLGRHLRLLDVSDAADAACPPRRRSGGSCSSR